MPMKLEEIEKLCSKIPKFDGKSFRAFVTRMAIQESTEEEIDYITCALLSLPKLVAVAKTAKVLYESRAIDACLDLNRANEVTFPIIEELSKALEELEKG